MKNGRNNVLILLGTALLFLGFYYITCHFNAPRYNSIHAVYMTERVRATADAEPKAEESTAVQTGKININTATKEELMQLRSIGEAKAQALIDYRKSNGRFREVYELTYVDGISDKIVAENLGRITV